MSGAFQVKCAGTIWRFRCIDFLVDYMAGFLLVEGAEAVKLELVCRLLTLIDNLILLLDLVGR